MFLHREDDPVAVNSEDGSGLRIFCRDDSPPTFQFRKDISRITAADNHQFPPAPISADKKPGVGRFHRIFRIPVGSIDTIIPSDAEIIQGIMNLAEQNAVCSARSSRTNLVREQTRQHGTGRPESFLPVAADDAVEHRREKASLKPLADRADVIRRETGLEIMDPVFPFHAHGIGRKAECRQNIGIGMMNRDPRFETAFSHECKLPFAVFPVAPEPESRLNHAIVVDIGVSCCPRIGRTEKRIVVIHTRHAGVQHFIQIPDRVILIGIEYADPRIPFVLKHGIFRKPLRSVRITGVKVQN